MSVEQLVVAWYLVVLGGVGREVIMVVWCVGMWAGYLYGWGVCVGGCVKRVWMWGVCGCVREACMDVGCVDVCVEPAWMWGMCGWGRVVRIWRWVWWWCSGRCRDGHGGVSGEADHL